MQKLDINYLTSLVDKTDYVRQDTLTICTISLRNGFKVVGTSACVNELTYDGAIGEQIAFNNAFEQLWTLEGYLLRQRHYEAAKGKIKLRNGNSADVVYESPFGKLLVVEQTGDELPAVHWHNADGSFYADEPSELDIT